MDDEGWVLNLIPFGETAALLDAVDAASRQLCGAQRCLLARLTDGRIKVVRAAQGQDATALAAGLAHRHGPLSAAYFIQPSPQGTNVCDLLRKRTWRQTPHGWETNETLDQPLAAGLSRNAAIFAASLGMSTGALP